jgi:glycosyltransferase involved in cell wall biosynthesis
MGPLKLLVFAHTPPPHHGQSYMVQQLLEVLGGDRRVMAGPAPSPGMPPVHSPDIECFHVDCRFSDELASVGRVGGGKILRLLRYCAEAIWCRWRYRPTHFVYIPAPPMRAPLVRDWLVMALCRPFYSRRIYYWQAAGLAEWLGSGRPAWMRWLSRTLLARPELSIVLGEYGRADAGYFKSRRVAIVPNCIPDPCPHFESDILPKRKARAERRAALAGTSAAGRATGLAAPERYRVLFIGACTREKGLFDALEAIALANAELRGRGSPLRLELNVAGNFWHEVERREFDQRIAQPDLADADGSGTRSCLVRYCGFVGGEEKRRLFDECDGLCFPTYYSAESFGIVIIEAMAHGMDIVTTRWRTIPELFPAGYSGLVEPRAPAQVAAALLAGMARPADRRWRDHFLGRYTREHYAREIRAALRTVLAPVAVPS